MIGAEDLVRVSWMRKLAASGEARRIRESCGVSGRDLAKAIGTSNTSVSHWETGRTAPQPELALRWLSVLEKLTADLEQSPAPEVAATPFPEVDRKGGLRVSRPFVDTTPPARSEPAARSRTFVLVLMEWDHSGVQKIWGPFATEADAREAETILTEYGLSGLWYVQPLLPLIGVLQ